MAVEMKDELIRTADEISRAIKEFDGDQHGQMKLLQNVDKLRYLLESPMDAVMKQWETLTCTCALNLLTEVGAFEKMPAEGAITTKDLAAALDMDESAIGRALRVVAMAGFGVETEPDSFAHNAKSRAYLPGLVLDFFKLSFDHMTAMVKLPDYFKSHTRKDFFDLKKSPYAYAHGLEGMTYYEAISHSPERLRLFNSAMVLGQQTPILGMFPFAKMRDAVEAEKDRPFIVDIGGGRGHVLVEIQKEAPAGFGGRLILQDREEVLEQLTVEDIPNIEKMVYDFYTPQPVKNAHIYYIQRILHDFYEPVCVQLLKNIASAMGPTSRVIIADSIRPEKTVLGGEARFYWLDFAMMLCNGKEKSKREFEEITSAAGLEIVKIWQFPEGTNAHIECRLKQLPN